MTRSAQRLRFQLQARHDTAPQFKDGHPAALVNCKPLLGGPAVQVWLILTTIAAGVRDIASNLACARRSVTRFGLEMALYETLAVR